MSTTTTNYGLVKPELTDVADITAMNPNWDTIDTELKESNDHIGNKSNPHGVTKSQVGLGNVDNTSDESKPVSTAQATAIADAKKAGTDAQSTINSHASNKSNPHGVTAAQVGLGNVNNTSDSAKPVSTAQATAIADAKAAGTTAQTNLNSHTSNKSNPHGVTAAQAKAVALAGDTMTGALNVRHKDGVMTFRPAADMNSSQPEHKNQLGIVANGNSVLNRWKLDGSSYSHLSAFYFGDKALQLYNASEGKTYSFYGEHYQARGFYSGKGNSTTFQHKIIGYGTLLIWSSKGICLVPMASTGDPAVALKSGSSSFYTIEQSVANWDGEWLTLTKTAENTLNVNGTYYNYAIL